ncbi:MAG: DUF6268 family outer membrane beta-barrel protein [Verrucomicrobiota bacterium]
MRFPRLTVLIGLFFLGWSPLQGGDSPGSALWQPDGSLSQLDSGTRPGMAEPRGIAPGTAPVKRAPEGYLGIYWNGDADFEDTGASLRRQEFDLYSPLWGSSSGDWSFGLGFRYRLDRLDFAGLSLDDQTLHRVQIPLFLAWAPENSRWSAFARLAPGLATDFEDLSEDSITAAAILAAAYQWTPTFKVTLGAYFNPDIDAGTILPSLGFQWDPNPEWSLIFGAPRTELQYKPHSDLRLKLALYSGGGRWNIEEDGRNLDLSHRTLRAGVGLETRFADRFWWSLWAGVNLFQEYELEEVDGPDLAEEDIEDSLFLYTGIRFQF